MTRHNDKDLIVSLKKMYKITEYKYITVNNKYYLDGENDLFTGMNLKQIQFILICLGLADNQITRYKEHLKDSSYSPEYINIKATHEVFYSFLGNNAKRNIELIKDLFQNENMFLKGFYSSYSYEKKEFNIIIDTRIFLNNMERNFTKVYLGDIIKAKSISSIYIKMKIYKFLNSTQYIEGIEEIIDEDIKIIFTKDNFKFWSGCDKHVSKYLKNTLISINKENDKKVVWCFSDIGKNEDIITISFSKKEYADHVISNGVIIKDLCFNLKEDKKEKNIKKII